MNQVADKVEVTVEEVKESSPSLHADRPSIVIETEARVDGRLRDTSIEVHEDDVPSIAVALLNADLPRQPPRGAADLPIALHCLAAGVVHAATHGRVRLHLQFDSGQVLPIEMSHDAAAALARALAAQGGDSTSAAPRAST